MPRYAFKTRKMGRGSGKTNYRCDRVAGDGGKLSPSGGSLLSHG